LPEKRKGPGPNPLAAFRIRKGIPRAKQKGDKHRRKKGGHTISPD